MSVKDRGNPLFTTEWREALRRGRGRAMPATITVIVGCVILWLILVANGAPVISAHTTTHLQRILSRNAAAIATGKWWRGITAIFVDQGFPALVTVMALVLAGGMQIERTYGTLRYVTVFVAAGLAGIVVALLVEPAHVFNAGTSAAAFGVGGSAAVDLVRHGVRPHRTFWIPVLVAYLILGFIFPAGVTWGAHVGGVTAGVLLGIVLFGTDWQRRGRLAAGLGLGLAISAVSLLAIEPAARHTVRHGPLVIGASAAPGAFVGLDGPHPDRPSDPHPPVWLIRSRGPGW